MKLILCSASPRRREFLQRLGVRFSVAPAHIDETQREGESAREYVMRMAREKAQTAAGRGTVALAADTIVLVGEEVLGKPRDRSDAERMLRILSGIEHRVITAVCVPPRARGGDGGQVRAALGRAGALAGRVRGRRRQGGSVRGPGARRGVRGADRR